MLEVTCFHCGQVVQISPDVERCSVCGTNLRKSISREQASGFFYERAADLAGAGDVLGALQVIQRGLPYVASSELNLLGAILCKRLGRLEEMRHYVAAIPVDDPLRGEGEWLLRSNQARHRAPPEPKKGNKAPVALPIVPDSDALPTVLDEVTPARRAAAQPGRPRRGLDGLLWLLLLGILGAGGWLLWQNPPAGLARLPGFVVGAEAATPSPAEAGAGTTEAPVPAAPLLEVNGTTPAGSEEPLLVPTPTVDANLARATVAPASIAAVGDNAAVAGASPQAFNLATFLEAAGRDDLVALPVQARLEGGTLVLEGTVESVEQRAALEFETRQAPGVSGVSMTNVRVRLPETYTVKEGDTLWDISVRLYGTPDQVEELFAANQDQMANAGALSVGMVLKVPAPE
jgi:nucleoid-associated protein YgaU